MPTPISRWRRPPPPSIAAVTLLWTGLAYGADFLLWPLTRLFDGLGRAYPRLVTAAVPDVPGPLIDQLAEGGRLVLPLAADAVRDEQMLVRVIKRDGELIREEHGGCRFVPLVGKFGMDGDLS